MSGVTAFVPVGIAGIGPERSAPPADRVISGEPRFTTWNVEERDGLEWEFCHILAGVSVIEEDGGAARIVRPGDSFLLRPGFTGSWEVVETTRKAYVIRL